MDEVTRSEAGGQPLVWIVLVNWNGWQDTIACIESLERLDHEPHHVVVVDNGSTDESTSHLRARFPDLDLRETNANLGFAGGNNVGVQHALEAGADYVWLLNNDTTVDRRTLSELVEAAQSRSDVGMWGSKIYYFDQPNVLWYVGGEITGGDGHAHHVGKDEIDEGQYDRIAETTYVTGCSLLASAETIRMVGAMSEDYFLYWEEVDWCVRAEEHGLKCAVQPASKVWHKVSASLGGDLELQSRYEMRNRLIFHWRHRRRRLPPVLLAVLDNTYRAYRAGLRAQARGALAGVRDFVLGRSGPILR